MKSVILAAVCVLLAAGHVLGAEPQTFGRLPRTAWDIINTNPQLTSLASLITANNLTAVLNNANAPVTVFAPNNAAIAALLAALPTGIAPTNPAVVQILLAHVFNGNAGITRVGQTLQMLNGQITRVGLNGRGLLQAAQNGGANGLRVNQRWRDGQNNTVTVNRQINAVRRGGVVYIATSVIRPANVFANIATLLAANPQYSTLATLAVAQNVVAAIDNVAVPKTLFGPNNQAFQAINQTVQTLTPAQVNDVLLYHVAPAVIPTPFPNAQVPTALAGQALTLATPTNVRGTGNPAGQFATVVTPNLYFPGGIFQGIDRVLIPTLAPTQG